MIYCNKCGKENSEGEAFCSQCGASLAPDTAAENGGYAQNDGYSQDGGYQQAFAPMPTGGGVKKIPAIATPVVLIGYAAVCIVMLLALNGSMGIGKFLAAISDDYFAAFSKDAIGFSVALMCAVPILALIYRALVSIRKDATAYYLGKVTAFAAFIAPALLFISGIICAVSFLKYLKDDFGEFFENLIESGATMFIVNFVMLFIGVIVALGSIPFGILFLLSLNKEKPAPTAKTPIINLVSLGLAGVLGLVIIIGSSIGLLGLNKSKIALNYVKSDVKEDELTRELQRAEFKKKRKENLKEWKDELKDGDLDEDELEELEEEIEELQEMDINEEYPKVKNKMKFRVVAKNKKENLYVVETYGKIESDGETRKGGIFMLIEVNDKEAESEGSVSYGDFNYYDDEVTRKEALDEIKEELSDW